jgi:hypothetical protein
MKFGRQLQFELKLEIETEFKFEWNHWAESVRGPARTWVVRPAATLGWLR